jgi:hypothetical protein
MVLWDPTGIVPLAELMGDLAVLFKVSPALTEKALTDYATVNSIVTWLSAPLAHFIMFPGVGYYVIH